MPRGVEDPVGYRGVVGFVRCASPTEHCKAGKWPRDKMTPILHNMSVMLSTKLQLST